MCIRDSLDTSGTRYVRVFYDKNYESVLDGEITETGVGPVSYTHLDVYKRQHRRNIVFFFY